MEADPWLKSYEESRQLAQDIVQLIQERNTKYPDAGPDASRMTASARKKLGTLGTQLDKLLADLDRSTSTTLTAQEQHRRRDLVYSLKNRREQILISLKRSQQSSDRQQLLVGASAPVVGRETEVTAGMDNRGLMNLQEQIMRQQDQELEDMEKAVNSTKHIALTIGEEVDLHTRLLEGLEDDVETAQSRLRATTKRITHLIKHSSNWKMGLCVFLSIVIFVTIAVIALKISWWLIFV